MDYKDVFISVKQQNKLSNNFILQNFHLNKTKKFPFLNMKSPLKAILYIRIKMNEFL